MAYRQDFNSAARRYLRAAQVLFANADAGAQPGCRAVAGYSFGLAGELAVKKMMYNSGMRPLAEVSRRDDPFSAHFPTLKTLLAQQAKGRLGADLKKIASDPGLFQNWDAAMRYAPTGDVKDKWVKAWKASAEALVERL